VLRQIPSLGEHLAEYDLLVTHFGLGAFEALHAGVPVLLVSPGPYHRRLARAAGFVSTGMGAAGAKQLGSFLARKFRDRNFRDLRERCRSLARRHGVEGEGGSLAEFITAIRPQFLARRCPCCGDSGAPLARFPRRSFRRCPRCGLIYQARIDEPPIEYKREYFFEVYKKQYGRTYLEDFPNLTSLAEGRLGRIIPLIPGGPVPGAPHSGGQDKGGPKLLDIGCAYGAFLQAASRSGFDALGLDPAEDAVQYVRDKLGLRARRGFFPSGEGEGGAPGPGASFSVLSLWYVIEHFRDPAAALAEGRRLLRDGGVLAFSTPSFSGVSGRTSLKTFLERSPEDHWTIWSPRSCRKILRDHGFRVKKILVTGHHPERFPLLGFFCDAKGGKKGRVYRFLSLLSRIFGLGDTFEVYAVKESRLGGIP
jgi:SAM-dependent methyltransferase